jgi:hypothetical protein
MNANELANLLEADSWYKLVTREEIATMLRQQQAKIEAFEKFITDNTERTEDTKMNNEPVAWMTENRYLITKDENLANIIKEKGEEPIIPLYTHPAKTLTDEDLFKVYADLQESYTGNNFPVDLGRAILRKAQEQ